MTLEEKLALSKKAQKDVERGLSFRQKKGKSGETVITGNVEDLDNMVYGKPSESSGYDAREEMKKIEERNKKNLMPDMTKSKIPSAILESIRRNPLNLDTKDVKMENFTEKLKNKMPLIQRTIDIQKKLAENDKTAVKTQSGAKPESIDYEMIKLIVENAVKKELSAINISALNENASHNIIPSLKALKITENGRFIFLDDNGYLYECTIKYIGKNKKKR